LGIETLRELMAERDRLQASNSVCITLGQVSAKARDFATQNRITLISNGDLVVLTADTFKTL
jgi:restriction system protein